jgi:circadian clock protein KaiB
VSLDLRLYVSRWSPRSQRAIAVVESLREPLARLGGTCEILDVAEAPEAAAEDRVLATPTLIRRAPAPPRRVVGDVPDLELLLDRLDLPRELLAGHEGVA